MVLHATEGKQWEAARREARWEVAREWEKGGRHALTCSASLRACASCSSNFPRRGAGGLALGGFAGSETTGGVCGCTPSRRGTSGVRASVFEDATADAGVVTPDVAAGAAAEASSTTAVLSVATAETSSVAQEKEKVPSHLSPMPRRVRTRSLTLLSHSSLPALLVRHSRSCEVVGVSVLLRESVARAGARIDESGRAAGGRSTGNGACSEREAHAAERDAFVWAAPTHSSIHERWCAIFLPLRSLPSSFR